METFLFVYETRDTLMKKIATAPEIARVIGRGDFRATYEPRVYRITAAGVFRMSYLHSPYQHCVDLFDQNGVYIASGFYTAY